MEIKRVIVGNLETNCYVLIKNNKALVIDPGDDYDKIIEVVGNNKIEGVLITHNHFDHVGALSDILSKYKVEVYDKNNLEEKEYNIDEFKFKVIYNPGHTSDSISYLFDNNLFCGDFIFKDSIGRWDLPTGDFEELLNSIDKIKEYNDLIIYPGHGDSTFLEEEKKNNKYFKIRKK